MHGHLIKLLTDEIWERMALLGINLHEVLTLASIVEKESALSNERLIIAGVFWNRLNRKMRLQADPTVKYGVGFKANKIRRKDLKNRHPYNTYVYQGLPPGPIASPSLEAIKAVLWPNVTKYLYFVSRNDGTHAFCESYRCHQKAVRKWQLN